MYFEYFCPASSAPPFDLTGVSGRVPAPVVEPLPRLGGSSHRFEMATLPRWKERLEELWESDIPFDRGVVFEIPAEEAVDPVLVTPVIDELGRRGSAWWVHRDQAADDLRGLWTSKWASTAAARRPALIIVQTEPNPGKGGATLKVEVPLHGWVGEALPYLAQCPLLSAALLRAISFPDSDETAPPPRLLSDRVSAMARVGLLQRASATDFPHSIIEGWVEKLTGPRNWRRPPRVYKSTLYLMRIAARRELKRRRVAGRGR